MIKGRRVKPKKTPSQKRSELTVNSILEAATYILLKDGLKSFTTNKIAEKAGVNIASLYQYFPNKESILVALHKRHVDKLKNNTSKVIIDDLAKKDLPYILNFLVDETIREHRTDPEIHHVLSTQASSMILERDLNWDSEMEKVFEQLISSKLKKPNRKKFAPFFIRTILHALVHDAIERHPEYLDDPAFAKELRELFESYLCG